MTYKIEKYGKSQAHHYYIMFVVLKSQSTIYEYNLRMYSYLIILYRMNKFKY